MISAVCGDGSEPIPASGADVAVTSSGGSVLTMKVMNAPDLTSKTHEGDCGPIGCLKGGLQVGTFIADVAIKRTVGAETILQVDFTGHTEPLGMAQGVLTLNDLNLAFDVVFFDNEVQISCVEADLTTRLPGCMTSGSTSVGAPNFIYVKLVNFNATREDVASKVVATFGGQPASGLVGFGGDVGTKTLILRLDAPRLSSDYL